MSLLLRTRLCTCIGDSTSHLTLLDLKGHSAIHPQIVLDLLPAHWVQSTDERLGLFAGAIIHRVHPSQRHSGKTNASEIPVVPFDSVLVHHVGATSEAALGELWQ